MKCKLLNWLTMVSMKGRGFEKQNAAGKNIPRLITFFHLHCILGKFTIAEKETDRLANLTNARRRRRRRRPDQIAKQKMINEIDLTTFTFKVAHS